MSKYQLPRKNNMTVIISCFNLENNDYRNSKASLERPVFLPHIYGLSRWVAS